MEHYNTINDTYLTALKKHTIKPKFKVELMDYGETVFAEITRDISKEEGGSISINYQQGVRRSCSITIANINGEYIPDANTRIWVNTKFKLYCGIQIVTSGVDHKEQEDIYWFSQGVYILTNPTIMRDLSQKTVTLNGIDKFGVFGSETNFFQLEGTYSIPANSTVRKIIQDVLDLEMGNGYKLDNKAPNIDAEIGAETTAYTLTKSAESYFGDMLIELGNMYAADIYYDNDGVLTVTKGNEKQNMDDYSALWSFSDDDCHYFTPSLELKFTEIYNTIKVVGTNSSSSETDYSEYNIPDANDPDQVNQQWYQELVYNSPTRASLIGRKTKYVESSFCYNSDRTKDFAKYLFRKNAIVQQALSFSCAFIPHLDVNKIIQIQDKYFQYENVRFVIQSLTIPISTNSLMEVQATNTANIPYFEY